MKQLIEKLNKIDRLAFFKVVIVFVLVVLLLQLLNLTLVQGEKYRELADSRRVKEIQITAQRGEIKDRNGIVIAGNRPVFTLQLRKDELDSKKNEEKNELFLKSSRYIEEDGVNYLNTLPLALYTFSYDYGENYTGKKPPMNVVLEKFEDPHLINELLKKKLKKPYTNHYDYSVLRDILKEISSDYDENPFLIDEREGRIHLAYQSEALKKTFKMKNDLPSESSALTDIETLLIENPNYIRQILDNPLARKCMFDVLEENDQLGNITLQKISSEYLEKYYLYKRELSEKYSGLNFDSSPKEVFYYLFRHHALEDFLQTQLDNGKYYVEYAYPLIEKEKNISFQYEKNQDGFTLLYEGKDGLPIIKEELEKNDILLEKFLAQHSNRQDAQSYLIHRGINPEVSIGDGNYQFTQLKNHADLLQAYDLKMENSVDELFQKMVEFYDINPSLSIFEKRNILNMHYTLRSQGSYAYVPIHFAYELDPSTVAMVEENISANQGIEISHEPIRDYPFTTSASHLLGYLGSIAQEREVKKYIEEEGYDQNAMIGKTGLEESFEKYLHGKNGKRIVSVDSRGNTTDVMKEEAPIKGNDVNLTIDIDLQKKTDEILEQGLSAIRSGGLYSSPWGNFQYIPSKEKGRPYVNAQSGSIVIVDVKTGEILALSNYPNYDPNIFSTGISSLKWDNLRPKEEDNPLAPRPLLNTAMQTAVQPGSIFKMVTGMAALEKGLDPNMAIPDGGTVKVGNQIFSCWLYKQSHQSHGEETLSDALRDSCNYYFYSLGLGEDQRRNAPVGVQIDATDIAEMAKNFGLGEETGIEINIPKEATGTLPDPESKREILMSLLRHHLQENLSKYLSDSKNISDSQKDAFIDQLFIFLFSRENTPSREDIYNHLMKIGIDPDARVEGQRGNLTDYIKYVYVDEAKWKLADTMNITIGQGNNSYTPLQLARYTMGLANRGNLYNLHLVKNIENIETKKIMKTTQVADNQIELGKDRYYDDVKKGMIAVAQEGPLRSLFGEFPVSVALKTGTAERSGENPYTNETFDSFAWEVGFAPADDPEIAVCILAIQGGSGSNCSPMMQQIMIEYFGLNQEIPSDTLPIHTKIDF